MTDEERSDDFNDGYNLGMIHGLQRAARRAEARERRIRALDPTLNDILYRAAVQRILREEEI